ncbi:hypothetical protein RQP46_000083 [Phenoliferia psychrophenolica]
MTINTDGTITPAQPKTNLDLERSLDFGAWFTRYSRLLALLEPILHSTDYNRWVRHGQVVQRLFTVENSPVAARYCLATRTRASTSSSYDVGRLNETLLAELSRAELHRAAAACLQPSPSRSAKRQQAQEDATDRGAPPPLEHELCFRCGTVGAHLPFTCGEMETVAGFPCADVDASGGLVNEAGMQYCLFFSATGCHDPKCVLEHTCSLCREEHGASSCPDAEQPY